MKTADTATNTTRCPRPDVMLNVRINRSSFTIPSLTSVELWRAADRIRPSEVQLLDESPSKNKTKSSPSHGRGETGDGPQVSHNVGKRGVRRDRAAAPRTTGRARLSAVPEGWGSWGVPSHGGHGVEHAPRLGIE